MNTAPEEPAESSASIVDSQLLGQELAGGGLSRATFPSNPGPDNQALDATLLGSEVVTLGGIDIPVTSILDFGELGVLQSLSEATSPQDARAISTTVGADGSLTLDNLDTADMDNARIDMVQLADSIGFGAIPGVDEAWIEFGALGSEVQAVDGAFVNPDAEHTGDGQYKVGDLLVGLRSDAFAAAMAQMLDAISAVDGAIEDSVNTIMEAANLLDPILSVLPAGVTADVSIESNVAGAVEEALLSEDLTAETSILDIDLGSGTIYIDIAEFMGNDEGARTGPDGNPAPEGLNNQWPNTEIIDSDIYPMIADSIHDVIENAIHIAVGAVAASLDAITINVDAEASAVGSSASKTFSVSLDGTYTSTACASEGLGGGVLCATLDGFETVVQPLMETLATTVADTLLADDGQILYDIFELIKTDSITIPARALVDPFLELFADNVFSVQINHQPEPTMCTAPDGTEFKGTHEVSALSFGVLGVVDGARLSFGNSGVRMDACNLFAEIDPAITVDPTEVPAGDSTNVDGTGFTPDSDVELQLTDAEGTPVGDVVPVTTDENGDFPSTELPVPAGTEPGDYIVQATDVATDTMVSENITVTEPDVLELNIGLDPPTVPAGESTEATGTGYTPDSTATVQLVDPAGTDVGDPIPADTDAEGTFTAVVPVPEGSEPGDYTVVGTDDTTGEFTDAALTVTEPGAPAIVLDPTEVPAGDPTTADGTGYTPDSTATVQLVDPAGTDVGDPIPADTDPDGAFTVEVPVPEDAEPGDYTVVGTDDTTGETAEAVLTVTEPTGIDPAIVLDPTEVPAGDPTTADGTGYTPDSTATVQLVDPAGTDVGDPIPADTDADGAFTVEVPVPEDAEPGDYTVVGTDDTTGETAEAVLTVTEPTGIEPTVSVDPTAVEPGESTDVTGENFAPNDSVDVQLVDPEGNPVGDPVTVPTDEEGNFTTPLTVPEDAEPGDYTVEAVDSEGNEGSADLEVLDPAAGVMTLTPNPAAVEPGETTEISGTGFTPGEDITVELLDAEGNPVTEVVTPADENGEILTDLVVPEDAVPGPDYVVEATDPVTEQSIDAPFEVLEPGTGAGEGSIGDFVWDDSNADGVQDEGEAGVPDVAVNLLDAEGNPVEDAEGNPVATLTDENGNYALDGLELGDYVVEFVAPEGKTFSPQAASGNDATDSDANPEDGRTDVVMLTEEMSVLDTVDAGLIDDDAAGIGSIGDFVWDDTNADGVQDAGEPGVPDVVVNLLDADGNVVEDAEGNPVSDTTDENGNYALAGLEVGDYVVEFVAPEGKTFSPQAASGNDATDSDANPEDGRTDVVTLTEEMSVLDTVDAGLIDADAAGEPMVTVDPTAVEPGESTDVTGENFAPNDSVDVQLVDPEGNPVGDPVTVPTDEEGNFTTPLTVPEDAEPGDYTVEAVDSEGNEGSADLEVLDPAAGVMTLTPNPAAVEPGETTEISGTGFTPGEDITVELLDAEGNPVTEVVTPADENGEILTDLVVPEDAVPGPDYVVEATDPATEQSIDAPFEVLEPGTAEPMVTVDPTAVEPGESTEVSGENFAPNDQVEIQLVDPEGNPVGEPVTVPTDENGDFVGELPVPEGTEPGDYTVEAVDSEGNEGSAPLEVLVPGSGDGSIGDFVWDDTNADGVQDAGESGVQGVVVNLLDADGNVVEDAAGDPVSDTTDENGLYGLNGLELGDYVVEFVAPEGKTFSPQAASGNDATDSDANPEDGRTDVVTLTEEMSVLDTVDAGLIDDDAAGEPMVTVDPTAVEPGESTEVSGENFAPNDEVEIQLVDPEGNPVGEPVTVPTDENGDFVGELPVPEGTEPGDYTVEAVDSEGNEGSAPLEVLVPGSGDGSIGDFVWDDTNADGVQDAGESGVQGVVVNLLDADGNVVEDAAGDPVSDTTDENGLYGLNGLELGDYVVEFVAPEGKTFSPQAASGNDATDSDANPEDGRTDVVTLTEEMSVLDTVDAGLIDDDAAGEPMVTVDPTAVEPGESTEVSGENFAPNDEVEIQLVDPEGNPVGEPVTVPTDENGDFVGELPVPEGTEPGDYTVEAVDSEGNEGSADLEVLDPAAGVMTIAADPAAALPGESTSVSGEGYTSDGDVTVELVNAEGDTIATVETVADENGEILTDLVVPADAVEGADYTIRGTDVDTEGTAETPFEVLALAAGELALTVDPTEGLPGDTATATGAGYTPDGDVTVELVDADGNTVATVDAVADEDGGLTADVVVPEDAEAGDYTVVGTDVATGESASAEYTVLDDGAIDTCAADPEVTVDPSTVGVGGTVTVSGVGFAPGTVTVEVATADGAQVHTVSAEVGEDCTFTVTFDLPAGAGPGDYVVTASDDDGNSDDTPLTITGDDDGGNGGNGGDGGNGGNGANGGDGGNGGGKLPSTGATTAMFALLALLLIAGGAVLVRFASSKSGRREV
ncbi:SdrD B-like domain-containing protein [Zhihengliuella halotolerans]|uniref:SdrD B-like domain-containing protein n=1 Tax=Zhihengliuella halotolerans TaxID=370736 RepID=UPI00102AAB50|nr:SdrD B-like domain-containing protein [Zhihengliuella halotolerans]